jgi:hypothetical protein
LKRTAGLAYYAAEGFFSHGGLNGQEAQTAEAEDAAEDTRQKTSHQGDAWYSAQRWHGAYGDQETVTMGGPA